MMRTGFSGNLCLGLGQPVLASSAQKAATAARHARMLPEISRLILFLPIVQLLF